MNNIHCVCTTPNLYPVYLPQWSKFPSTKLFEIVADNTSNKHFSVGFTFDEETLRQRLNFYNNPGEKHYWQSHGRSIVWFYAHFRMMNYYLSHPDYDYYWFFDDDVFVNNWEEFFSGFESHTTDFISYFCFKSRNVQSQPHISETNDLMFSKGNLWFERFPGQGDVLPTNIEHFGSFFPVTRFSNKAFQELYKIHTEGYYGYSEGFVPTILNHKGLSIDSIYQSDNSSKFFDIENVKVLHKGIQVTWGWL